jgi:hypothetical protein
MESPCPICDSRLGNQSTFFLGFDVWLAAVSTGRIAHRIGRVALMKDLSLFFLRVFAPSREINRLPYPTKKSEESEFCIPSRFTLG